MKFKSALLTSASGSIGGMTASRNPGGLYLRARVVPTNPDTGPQQEVRRALAELAAKWITGLTTSQRNAWKTFAKNVPVRNSLGDNIIISSLAWFMKANVMRQRNGSGVQFIADGPTNFSMGEMEHPTAFTLGSPTDEVSFLINPDDPWASAPSGRLFVYTGLPQNRTVNFYKGPFTLLSVIAGAVINIPAAQTVILPSALSPQQRIFLRFVSSGPDGRPSNAFIQRVDA